MEKSCCMVVGQVSTLIENYKVEVAYSALWIAWGKDNWTRGVAEVNF